jgi:hypothetical protein
MSRCMLLAVSSASFVNNTSRNKTRIINYFSPQNMLKQP